MKQTLLTLMLFLATLLAGAQVIEETAPQPAQPKAPTYNSSLLLDVDVSCQVFLDGDARGAINAGTPLKLPANAGQHLLQLRVFDNQQLHKETIELEKDKQSVISLSLRSEYNKIEGEMKTLAERNFWQTCLAANEISSFTNYINEYPNGQYVNTAKQKITQIQQAKEDQIWQECLAKEEKSFYQNYLTLYPNGRYVATARQTIKMIDDNAAWQTATNQNTIESYTTYLETSSTGNYTETAKQKIEQIRKENEDLIWQACLAKNEIASFQNYISEYPNGEYIIAANQKITELEQKIEIQFWQDCIAKNELALFQKYISDYPNGQYVNDAYQKIPILKLEMEDQVWQECVTNRDMQSVSGYLAQYPQGRYVDDANQLLIELEEDMAWQDACDENTIESYNLYNENYPWGKYFLEMKQKIHLIQWNETKALHTYEAYDSFIKQNPKSIFMNEALLFVEEDDWNNALAKDDIEMYKQFLQKHKNGKYAEEAAKFVAEDIFKTSGVEMIFVKGGTFLIGCSRDDRDCEEDEKGAKEIFIDSYFIAKYELTQQEWGAIRSYNPSSNKGCKTCPVEMVSMVDAVDFISELNTHTGKKFRLPTEAEWEYAARGGASASSATATTYAGSNTIDDVAWYDGNSNKKTHPVGQKQPNMLGLYDMSGNVWEWCNSEYCEHYWQTQTNENNPSYLKRGGAWDNGETYLRITNRSKIDPNAKLNSLGFRLAMDI